MTRSRVKSGSSRNGGDPETILRIEGKDQILVGIEVRAVPIRVLIQAEVIGQLSFEFTHPDGIPSYIRFREPRN